MKQLIFSILAIFLVGCQSSQKITKNMPPMKIRIAEIEVFPAFLEEYLAKAKNVGAISVQKEKGVICIFPMQMQENPNQIRIVEIYADEKAYQFHIQTPHFQEYKTSTLQMIKSLKLMEMNALDEQGMKEIFDKLKK